ncbi:beta-lactamase/transpeptidase-like protein [Aspergillus aurantiobrunneus]
MDDTPLERLNECLPQIAQIHSIFQSPSLTLGVLHHGNPIFKHSIGHRNPTTQDEVQKHAPPNPQTIYMLGSVSKMFISAALGILISEGKLAWTDPIRKHIPEFDPASNPRIAREADIIDCLRHSTGLTAPHMLCLGPRGTIVSDEDDLVALLNCMPSANERGEERFNREWGYNNYVYGLGALIVQRVSGMRFAEFVRGRILEPLGMRRTSLTRGEVEGDENVAVPCVRMADGRDVRVHDASWPCEWHSALLGCTGMRSCLDDMLVFCAAVLDAERAENEPGYLQVVENNPLKEMRRVRRGYWTRPADDPEFSKETAYCMGWWRARLPSSMLGSFSGNRFTRDTEHRMHLQHILGRDAAPFQMVGHTGGMRGSIFSVFTFPETQSAVVTMTNGRDLGDASDFAAQVLIQALFDLKPAVDLTSWAKEEAQLAARWHREHIERPWEEDRRLADPEREPVRYAGHYRGFNDRFTLSVLAHPGYEPGAATKLSVIFNHRKASECPLVFYKTDVYSFFQPGEDSWKSQQIFAGEYRQMLLEFQVDGTDDRAQGLWWQWDTEAKPAWLGRIPEASG